MAPVSWEQPRRPRGRRAGVALAALALLGALAWLASPAWLGGDGSRPGAGGGGDLDRPAPPRGRLEVGSTDPEEPEGGADGARPRHGGWRLLPHAPLVRRYGHSVVWTGSHLVVWGGARSDERPHGAGLTELRSGASFDLGTRRWRRLPPSPLDPRLGHVAVAAGGEMVVWGGQRDGPAAAAYDPVTLRWRALPPGPVDQARPRGAAWTGRFVLVWGSLDGRLAAAAYEPASGSWTRLPDPPFETSTEAELVWADGGLLLWQPPAEGQRALVASWSPGGGRWRMHRPARGAPGPVRLLAAGDRVLAWGGPEGERWAVSYEPSSRAREAVALPPIDPEAEVIAGWDGEGFVVWSSSDNRTLWIDPATGRASALPGAPLAPRGRAGAAAWPGGIAVWGGASPERHYADGAILELGASPPG